MIGFSKRQWVLALVIAALIHGGAAFFMLHSPPSSGSIAAGAGGITVALGPAGRAPGAAEVAPPPAIPANVELFEELEDGTPVDRQLEETLPEETEEVQASDMDEAVLAEASDEITPSNAHGAQAEEPDTTAPEPATTAEMLNAEMTDQVPNAATTAPPDQAVEEAPSSEESIVAEAVVESQPSEAATVDLTELSEIIEPEEAIAPPAETAVNDDDAIDPAEDVKLDEGEEVAVAATPASDAPNEIVPSLEETVPEAPEEPAPTVEHLQVAEADQIAPKDVAARSPDATPVMTAVLPPPPEPSIPEAEPTQEEQPEAQHEPAQLAGAGGEAGDQDEGDLGSGQNSSGGGAVGARANYFAVLQAWIEQHKVYPRRALSRRLEGVASLRFVMDREGQVLDYQVERSSGHRLLDRAVETLIERAQPLPMVPDEIEGANLTLVVPISFVLNR